MIETIAEVVGNKEMLIGAGTGTGVGMLVHWLMTRAGNRLDHLEKALRDEEKAKLGKIEGKVETLEKMSYETKSLADHVHGSAGRAHQRLDLIEQNAFTLIRQVEAEVRLLRDKVNQMGDG